MSILAGGTKKRTNAASISRGQPMTGTIGEIITFYSYKGGTGRSMALSNVACLLAGRQSKGRGVLMIDWDLEAPGLHRFFQNRFKIPAQAFEEKPGLIDLFLKIDAITPKSIPVSEEAEKIAYDALNNIDLDNFIVETDIDYLCLLKAGRFDANYSNKVNSFDWESLHNRSPLLIRLFAEKLAEKYRYVLIDSRTGYTDISGICTMLMPEKLVVVFTPNRQNYSGIKELVKMALKYRRKSDDLRPLLVFPLPSRIEFSIDELRRNWRFGKRDQDIEGFQPIFENLFKEVYELNECNLEDYFDEVQIQQNPYYAYGEEIAVIAKRIEDRFALTESFKIFTNWLVNSTAPWGMKEKTSDIFLSYAQVDRAKAQAIAEALEQQGFSVWWDRAILPGTKFDEVNEKKLKSAKCVIVLWSKDSMESEGVQNEAFEGAKNQTLIQILIDDVMPPLLFRERQTANLINWQENVQNENFDRLVKAIKKLLGGIKEGQGDRQGIANKLEQLATIDMNQGEYEAAIQKFQKLLEIRQQIGDRAGEAAVWFQLATIDMNQREYEAAIQNFQKSLEIKQNIGDREGVAGVHRASTKGMCTLSSLDRRRQKRRGL
jgi:cellulose biosynthesis protein BcsQ